MKEQYLILFCGAPLPKTRNAMYSPLVRFLRFQAYMSLDKTIHFSFISQQDFYRKHRWAYDSDTSAHFLRSSIPCTAPATAEMRGCRDGIDYLFAEDDGAPLPDFYHEALKDERRNLKWICVSRSAPLRLDQPDPYFTVPSSFVDDNMAGCRVYYGKALIEREAAKPDCEELYALATEREDGSYEAWLLASQDFLTNFDNENALDAYFMAVEAAQSPQALKTCLMDRNRLWIIADMAAYLATIPFSEQAAAVSDGRLRRVMEHSFHQHDMALKNMRRHHAQTLSFLEREVTPVSFETACKTLELLGFLEQEENGGWKPGPILHEDQRLLSMLAVSHGYACWELDEGLTPYEAICAHFSEEEATAILPLYCDSDVGKQLLLPLVEKAKAGGISLRDEHVLFCFMTKDEWFREEEFDLQICDLLLENKLTDEELLFFLQNDSDNIPPHIEENIVREFRKTCAAEPHFAEARAALEIGRHKSEDLILHGTDLARSENLEEKMLGFAVLGLIGRCKRDNLFTPSGEELLVDDYHLLMELFQRAVDLKDPAQSFFSQVLMNMLQGDLILRRPSSFD